MADPFDEVRDRARRRASGSNGDDGNDGLDEDEERNVREGIGAPSPSDDDDDDRDRDRGRDDDDDDDDGGPGLSDPEMRNAREGIGGSGSRAGDDRERAGEEQERARERAAEAGFTSDSPLGGGVGDARAGSRAPEGGDLRLQRDAERERSPEGGDVRLLEESQRQRGIEGGDVRLLQEEQRARQDQRERDYRNVFEGIGGPGSRAGRGTQAPNISGGDVRLLTASGGTGASADGVDFSEARSDPVGFLRGAGPEREAAFLNELTGGTLERGREAEQDFRAAVTPGESIVRQEDVATGLQRGIQENRESLSTAAALGVATPEPLSSVGGAIGLGLIGVGAAAASGEIDTPERPVGERAEIETPDEPLSGLSEVSVPEGQRRISPSEIGLPDDLFTGDSGEIDVEIDGPGRITDDGDIEVPIEATQVAAGTRLEDEEEGEAEEEDEEAEEEEAEEEERVVVNVPEEFIPDEEVTIGRGSTEAEEAEQTEADAESETEEADEELLPRRRQGQGQRDAFPDSGVVTGGLTDRPATREREDVAAREFFEGATQPVDALPQISEVGGALPAFSILGDDREGTAAAQPELSLDAAADDVSPSAARPRLFSPTLAGVGAAQVPRQAPRQAPQLDLQQRSQPRFERPESFAEPAEYPDVPGDLFSEEPRQRSVSRAQPRRANMRRPRLMGDLDPDQDDDLLRLIGGAGEELTDFRNPLTGEVLETQSAVDSSTREFELPGL